MTNATLLFGKNKVFIIDYYAQLDHFGLEDNLYIVRLADDGTEDNKMYEWRSGAYVPFSFGSGSGEVTPINEASIEVYDERKDLPLPINAKNNTLYVVLMDITAERKTTMYLFVDGTYLLLAAFSASGSIQEYTQVTKLGVEANETTPRSYEIAIPRTTNFLRAPIEVLKFTQGNWGVVRTVMDFDNGDATDFEVNPNVIFDGVMKLLNTQINMISMHLNDDSEMKYIYKSIIQSVDKMLLKKIMTSGGKTLIFHNEEYKKFNDEWIDIPQGSFNAGMETLSPLLDRSVQVLKPFEMTVNSTQATGGNRLSRKLDLNKYFDIKKMRVEADALSRVSIGNPAANQHYSLSEKTLILLPDATHENVMLHGTETGKEIQLDEAFDKIEYINELSTATQGTSGKIVTVDLLEPTTKILKINEVR